MAAFGGIRRGRLALLAMGAVLLAALGIGPSYAADSAKVYVVQGLPGKSLDIAVDGASVAKNVRTAAIAGPISVNPGKRKISFRDGGQVLLERTFTVKARSSW